MSTYNLGKENSFSNQFSNN